MEPSTGPSLLPDRAARPRALSGPVAAWAAAWDFLGTWAGRAFSALVVTGVGILLGQQYMNPNKRVLPVLAAIVVVGIAWRLDLVTSIGVLIFLLPYPKGTTFGTTNVALALIIAILWLVNASMRRSAPPRRTPIDMPLLGLLIMYAVSFYNVTNPEYFPIAMSNAEIFFASVLVYYIIVANVNTGAAIERIHVFQVFSALSVFLLAIYELKHPGQVLGGGWIYLAGSTGKGGGEEFATKNIRIGSAFADYELLSEFSVLTLLLAIFLLARARTKTRRALLVLFTIFDVFIMFATVTRGAIFSLVVGLLVLLWTTRRRLQFVPMVVGTCLFLSLFIGMNFYVSHYTTSGDMFARLSQTHFENGVPDSRVAAWGPALQRALTHPWIGQGPFYAPMFGFGFTWPHCVYLYYANIVGFIGLAFYLLILLGLARVTRPSVDNLRHPDYVRAYQVVAQAQFVAFVVNEMKIDYLRNTIYQTVVWAMFSIWVATYFVARRHAAEEAAGGGAAPAAVPAGRPLLPVPAR